MSDIPQIIGGEGHGELTHASKVNTAKNVDANFKKMIKDGRIAPETPAEMQMLKEHEANSDNALDEPIEDDMAMDFQPAPISDMRAYNYSVEDSGEDWAVDMDFETEKETNPHLSKKVTGYGFILLLASGMFLMLKPPR